MGIFKVKHRGYLGRESYIAREVERERDIHREVSGFSKIRSTLMGVPKTRIIVCLGLHWGSPYFRKLPD